MSSDMNQESVVAENSVQNTTVENQSKRKGYSGLAGLDRAQNAIISKQRLEQAINSLTQRQQEYVNNVVPDKYKRLVAEALVGNRTKAFKANCLACSNFQQEEVKLCTTETCPAWSCRPYQDRTKKEDADQEDDE